MHKYFFGFTPEEIFSACDGLSDRDKRIVELKLQGKSCASIGRLVGLVKSRICQILQKVERKASYKKEAHLPKSLRQEDSVFDLELSVRAENCFRDMGIYSIGDLLGISFRKLLNCRNMGRKTLNEIESSLQKHGFGGLRGF